MIGNSQPTEGHRPATGHVDRSTKCASVVRFLAIVMLYFVGNAVTQGSDSAISFARIEQVVAQWSIDQHLYIKGDLGVSPERLDELEQWLDQHGSHWTVILMSGTDGETFATADGRHYFGMDAVEYALERGLENQSGYGRQEDPRTGERNGTVFLLSLADRSFTYFSSDAQNARRLGKANWLGELDRPAYRAMSAGGRIMDAVQDTITSIDQAMDQRIASEQEAVERIRRERERAVEEVREEVREGRSAVERVLEGRQQLVTANPTATGALANPPVSAWRSELDRIEAAVTPEQVRELQQALAQTRNEIERYLNGLHEYEHFGEKSQPLEERIHKAPPGPNKVAVPLLDRAQEQWTVAKRKHTNAELDWSVPLQESERLLNQATVIVEQEQQRLVLVESRARRVRQMAAGGAITLGLVAVGGLILLNRRRRDLRDQALKQFQSRQQQVQQGMEGMFRLLERTGVIVGKREDLAQRGCEGETLRLSEQTIADVDNLFVMSRSVDRVFKQATRLVHPSKLWPVLVNLFGKKGYQLAINLLAKQKIRFRPEDGIQLLQLEGQEKGRELFGDIAACEAFEMSFDELLSEFDRRAARATTNLDTIEHAWSNLAPALESMQSKVDLLEKREEGLASATQQDALFDLQSLFDRLLPAALLQRDQAESIGSTDPVRAMQGPVAIGLRQIDEADKLVTSIERFRAERLPGIRTGQTELQQAGHQVTWIDEALDQFSSEAATAIDTGLVRSMHPETEALSANCDEFARRVEETIALVQRRRNESEPRLAKSKQRVSETRARISSSLHIAETDVLSEEGRDPNRVLQNGDRQLAAAIAAIDRGAVKGAASALEEVVRLDDEANAIVSATIAEYERHDAEVKRLWQMADQIFSKHSSHENMLAALVAEYAPEALLIQRADPAFPDDQATIKNHGENAVRWMADARGTIDLSNNDFRAARILQSADRRSKAEDLLRAVETCYEQIRRQADRLQEQVATNQRLSVALTARGDGLQREAADSRTRVPTQNRLHDGLRSLQQALRVVHAPSGQRSPFTAVTELKNVETLLNEVEQWIRTDREAHAEAVRSYEAAAGQLATARQAVGAADADQIPDSAVTTQSVADVRAFGRELEKCKAQLDTSHADWTAVDEMADKLLQKIGHAIVTLRGELERGDAAVRALESAASEVRRAAGWTGGYGVTILGSPGADPLNHGRSALNAGNYDQAVQYARQAEQGAAQAVRQAELQVLERRREHERQEAERRRQSQRNSMSLVGSSFSSGSSNHRSSGSSSSGSSHSRSHFSSGSSFKRSGW